LVLEPAGLIDLAQQNDDNLPATISLKEARIPKACQKELCLMSGSTYGGWVEVNDTNVGVLTQPLVLINHAEANNPYLGMIRRGKLIRERLLCQEVKPPPPGIPPIPEGMADQSPRELLKHHTRSGSCKKCHEQLDPLGGPFEIFDALGRFRDAYRPGVPIDTSGGIVGTLDADGPVENLSALMTRLSKSDQVRDCYVRQWFRFAFGRIEGPQDQQTLKILKREFKKSGYKIRDLILAITKTEEFRTIPAQSRPSPVPGRATP